jgi:UPF0042 nucleotide-binding protein
VTEYLIVTGMSGAGRSTAAATFEDLGWFVIDNLPPALIGKVGELTSPSSEWERVCLVIGRGGAENVAEVRPAIESLRSSGGRVRVLFLDASDEVLVRRYEGTRRRHPVEADGVLQAVRQERTLLQELRDDADVVLETSDLNVHELRAALLERFQAVGGDEEMEVSVVSFGFKHGLPLDVDLVFDCRFLPNPHWVEELRPHTGLDDDVRSYVLSARLARDFLAQLREMFALLLPSFVNEGKSYLSVAIGCTGGRHRSVVLAEELARLIAELGFEPTVHHRDIDR